MTRNVLIYPNPNTIEENNGIGRVVHAQYKYLPQYDINLVGKEEDADVVFLHTQMYDYRRVDILGIHGIYWTGDPGSGEYNQWHQRANEKIADASRRASKIVVPSEWVAEPFRRDMLIEPVVIPHGIDYWEWVPLSESERKSTPQYLLWGKNRPGDVCSPVWVHKVAELGVPVVSTFAPPGPTIPENMKVTGKMTATQMKAATRAATALLVTTKETFGIHTLEALASGVPVLCFDFGGQKDIIQHKVNGYKVAPYDVEGLVEGWEYILSHWKEMSDAARARAEDYSWAKAASMYAELFQKDYFPEPSKVSVVIPCYNYAKYVGEAIESVLNQAKPADEIIVVDDGSTDNSLEIINAYKDKVVVVEQENAGVASARNRGIEFASGNLVVCLDADDRLDPEYIRTLVPAFESDKSLGIAYTGLGLLQSNGEVAPNPWPPAFSWEEMSKPTNPPSSCIHSGSMFRKELWKRAGHYTQSTAPAEDTYLWLTGLSRGFTAEKVVDDYLFHYRAHSDSASRTKQYRPFSWVYWLENKQFPFAAPAEKAPPVRSYSEPLVSVIIPLSESHLSYVRTAIRSVFWQNSTNWELHLIADGFDASFLKEEFPYIKYHQQDKLGTGAARNLGITSANVPFVLFLDADDWLVPNALHDMLQAYKGKYIYTDWVLTDGDKQEERPSGDYSPEAALKTVLHPVTVLMPTEQAKILFDESLPALEDFDFFARAAIAGYHGERLSKPLVVVNVQTGERTKSLRKSKDKLVKAIQAKQENKTMASCCGGNTQALEALRRWNDAVNVAATEPVGNGLVRVEFVGETKGATSWGGPKITPSGRVYRGGNNPFEKYVDANPEDVKWLEGTGKWKRVSLSTL